MIKEHIGCYGLAATCPDERGQVLRIFSFVHFRYLGLEHCWLLTAAFDKGCVGASLFVFSCIHYPIEKLRVKLSAGV